MSVIVCELSLFVSLVDYVIPTPNIGYLVKPVMFLIEYCVWWVTSLRTRVMLGRLPHLGLGIRLFCLSLVSGMFDVRRGLFILPVPSIGRVYFMIIMHLPSCFRQIIISFLTQHTNKVTSKCMLKKPRIYSRFNFSVSSFAWTPNYKAFDSIFYRNGKQ